MKCPKCDGTGEMQICEMGFIGKDECDKCHGKGYLNNEEWFTSLSTEEKAKVLYDFFIARTFCHICPENNVCDIGYKCKYRSGEVEDFIKWLKQPHKEN